MFYKAQDNGFKQAMPGIQIKTLVYGENTLLSQFKLAKGHALPLHSHPHEQTGYLVTGRLKMTIGPDTFDAAPGDSWCIPGDTTHSAEVLEDAIAIEVFSPVREEYLPG
ncbi:MAG: cupin domain-containing protein [Desulfotignum sp.]|nr:cupin domain-containing protein [Desulfobacteraceae bacterium]